MAEKMSATTNALNWFEIAVTDMDRATRFYEAVLDIKLFPLEMMGMQMALFPTEAPYVGGALAKSPNHNVSQAGTTVYLNCNPDLQKVLDRVPAADGHVAMGKTSIGENGFMAFIIDSEGNKIGLHSTE